jgi:hypothetical protein
MRKLDKTITSLWEKDFLAFPSYLLKYYIYLDEILMWEGTIGSVLVPGIVA